MNAKHPSSDHGNAGEFGAAYELILSELRQALDQVAPEQIEAFVSILLDAEHVFLVGVGRMMFVLQAFAKRLNHLGVSAHCVGDVNEPAISDRDVLIVGSGSGESVVPVAIAKVAHKHKAKIVHIGSNPNSSLAPLTDLLVRVPVTTKLHLPDEIKSRQPMSSLMEQAMFVLTDAVCCMIAARQNRSSDELWKYHANLE